MVLREALLFLEEHKTGPFFLYLPFNLPHYPYQPDADLAEKYSGLPEPRGLYAAMVGTVDRRIGQVLQKVEELGIREDTLIFYMSDNGHSTEDYWNWDINYGAHGGGGNTGHWRGAKSSFLEGGIRVPAIISMPGRIPEGEVRDQVVSNMDLVPSVVEMCGLAEPKGQIDGHSLWPVIADAKAPSAYPSLFFQWQDRWMAREGDWKLLYRGIDTTGRFSSHPERERDLDEIFLANLTEDKPEWNNHAADQPEIVARLQALYQSWAEDVFT
jgi:arylsulfatase A-like enzyme